MLFRIPTALALAVSIAGAAHAYAPVERDAQILSQLPADAPPGECYARVKTPSEPAAPPPMMTGAQWVLNPGPPGSPGPIWCLVPTGPQPVAAAPVVERYGWIRVLCDNEVTPARIRGVQKRLHDHGYYRGELNGRYDGATAAAVGHFQSSHHIDHGGYLSMQTLDVLDGSSSYGPPPVYAQAPAYGAQSSYGPSSYGYSYGQGYGQGYGQTYSQGYGQAYPQAPAYGALPNPCLQACYAPPPPPPPVYYQPCCQAPVYQAPVFQPPCCQPPVYAPPCCAAPYPAGGYVQGYYGGTPTPAYAAARAYAGGASASAYASSSSAIQNGWLTWGGMTRY